MPKTTTTKPRLIFFGSGQASATILEDLVHSADVVVVGVVSRPGKQHSHTHQRTTHVAQLATEHNIKLFTPQKLTEITQQLAQLQPEAGVLFAYGKILPDETLNVFPKGIINIHPSLLPRHRGPAPLESTILGGDTQAGTSIMLITAEMDAGPILAQESFPITATIHKAALWEKLMHTSRKLLLPTLRDYLTGQLAPQPQRSDQEPSYSKLIKKQDGDITPHTASAANLERMVRAYTGWPGVRVPIILHGKALPLTLHEIRISSSQASKDIQIFCKNKQLFLQLSDGCVEILRAQLPGKSVVTGPDLCNAGLISLA